MPPTQKSWRSGRGTRQPRRGGPPGGRGKGQRKPAGVAAVPSYVGNDFTDTPPGHRFGLYFEMWKPGIWERAGDEAKREALRKVLSMGKAANDQLAAVRVRQAALAGALGDEVLRIETQSTAPFMTGVGMEHPLENGFAFLNPYGLPYLPGASVKGVLRQAAESLALGLETNDSRGWDVPAVWWLFGFDATAAYLVGPNRDDPDVLRDEAEARRNAYLGWAGDESTRIAAQQIKPFLPSKLGEAERKRCLGNPEAFLKNLAGPKGDGWRRDIHFKGRLVFWDVFPEPAGGKLDMDILTPHYTHYYQKGKGEPPHDSGQPVPNQFLTVPEGSRFTFYVSLAGGHRLPDRLKAKAMWKKLVEAAFDHAFAWHGFGAKTAVGYGAMARAEAAAPAQREVRPPEAGPIPTEGAGRRLAAPPPRLARETGTVGGERVEVLGRELDGTLHVHFLDSGDTEFVLADEFEPD